MGLLILYLLLALVVSFLCSIMESVLLSTPPSYLVVMEEEGYQWAQLFKKHKDNIDQPLSAILSLNTVAHTVGAAGVGAQAVKVFGETAFGITSAVLTILILIITEIIPKTLGARFWRQLAGFTTYLIRGTIIITYPLVIVSSLVTRIFSKSDNTLTTSREEIAAMASIGATEGVFSDNEDKIIQNLIKLKDVHAKEIMTPRVVVATANENITLSEFLASKDYLKFSRIPVFSDNEENITGYVIREQVFEMLAEDEHEMILKEVKRPILLSPSTIPLFSLWEKLLSNTEHISLLVDEYGGVDGIVTLEDIIETMLGLEIIDEKDAVPDMQEYARRRWKKKQVKYNLLDELNNETSDS